MSLDWSTLALQTVNFAVLVWLLHRFLYRPVLKLVDARRAEVQQQMERVKAIEEQAKAQVADLEKQRANIVLERDGTLKSAAARAEEAAQTRRMQAEREAKAIVDSAREAALAERESLLTEARELAVDLAADFAGRVIAEMPAALCADAWIDRLERHLQSLPPPDLAVLVGQLADGSALTLVTSTPIPDNSVANCRSRLERTLGTRASMKFEVNPELVSGAELHFPAAILDFSGRGALAVLRSQLDVHDDSQRRTARLG